VGDKKTGFDVTAIRIFSLLVEDLTVEVNVVVIDGIIEGDSNHLRHVLASSASGTDLAEVTRNLCAILGTEAVRELANVAITWRGTIRVSINIASVLIRAIITILVTIAEKASRNAVAISASQLSVLAQWFISEQKGFNFFLFGFQLTVFDRGLPITSLFLNVEG
jgi:hypothetical protein